MTQEEKFLIIQDVCARLPHGVIVEITSDGGMVEASYDMRLDAGTLADILHCEDDFKPYLRPMSSMTEKERKELAKEQKKDEDLFIYIIKKSQEGDDSLLGTAIPHYAEDWANKNHFDYRGLIEKSLAIVAPEGMYK